MLRRVSRYTHLPLAAASILLLVAIIAWLLVHRMRGLDPGWPGGTRSPDVVTIPATQPEPAPTTPSLPGPPADPERAGRSTGRPTPVRAAAALAGEQYVLESGPFTAPEVADAVEDRLNRLGHATVRFRKQDATRFYVVALSGFASREEAQEAARQLGHGTVAEGTETAEVVVARLPSLGEAVSAARPLRERGFEVRVTEALAPTVIYHLRYGRFDKRADAQTLRDELARDGIRSRVLGIQASVFKSR